MNEDKTNPIDLLLEQVPEKTGSKALEALEPETREILEDFAKWMTEVDGKSEATAKAYKSYVATALVLMKDGGDWSDLSTDVRSGVNAFVRYTRGLTTESVEPVQTNEVDDDFYEETYEA